MRLVFWLQEHKKISLVLLFLFVLSGFFYFFLFQPLWTLHSESKTLPRLLRPARNAAFRQDLETLAFEMSYLRPHFASINYSAKRLAVFSFLPKVGVYARDLKNLTTAFLPLYDGLTELGSSSKEFFNAVKFEGWGKLSGGSVANQMAKSLSPLSEAILKFKGKFLPLGQALASVDENNYPVSFRGRPLRAALKNLKTVSQVGTDSFDDAVSLLNLVPEVLGGGGAQNYLILIQNEKEVRPAGGFLSGYAILSLESGHLKLLKSGDLSFLDEKFVGARLPLPPELRKVLKTQGLLLRDANFSPDFKVSAQNILDAWQKTPDSFALQGVLAVDEKFLSSLVKSVGAIGLEDGTQVDADNVDGFLNKFFLATGSRRPDDQRQKGATSYLLNELLKKTLATLPQTYSLLLPELHSLAQEKHLLLYFKNDQFQTLMEKYNLAGRVKDFDGDYLQINHGFFETERKSFNLNQKTNLEIKTQGEKIFHDLKLEVELKPAPATNRQAIALDLLRIYVPKGAKLTGSQGFSESVRQSEDLGKTVFASTLVLRENGKIVAQLQYETPRPNPEGGYRLLVQKQPGMADSEYEIEFSGKVERINLRSDTEITINF